MNDCSLPQQEVMEQFTEDFANLEDDDEGKKSDRGDSFERQRTTHLDTCLPTCLCLSCVSLLFFISCDGRSLLA